MTIPLTFITQDAESTALNRRESLLHYLTHPLAAPTALPDGATYADLVAYNQQRMDYLSGGIVLGTNTVLQGQLLLTRAFQENRARNSGHSGVILSGNSTLGKTTTAKRLMRWVLDEYSKQVPDWAAYEQVPVMYVEVPADSSAKGLLKEFAAFFGLPVLTRDSTSDLRTKVVAAIRRARTQLIVVDELQNLAGRGTGEAVDLLKGLHNDVAATFLYCGIDVMDSSLMNGPRGQQLKNRFTALHLTRYEWSNPEQRKQWGGLVQGFEKHLLLRNHPVKTLAPHYHYLWERTGGSIGSLGRLLTGTAIDLIQNGADDEILTRELLDAYTLDHAAEEFYAKVRSRRKASTMTATEKVMS